jgi:uncharacterized lipoprotein YmbA
MAVPLKITMLAAFMLLGACRSEPINFHTLTPVELSASRAGAQIPIEGISVPPQSTARKSSSVRAMAWRFWKPNGGASLADELRSALSDQLSNTGSRGNVSVRIDVQRFDSIPGHYGLIDVKWRLRPSGAADNAC